MLRLFKRTPAALHTHTCSMKTHRSGQSDAFVAQQHVLTRRDTSYSSLLVFYLFCIMPSSPSHSEISLKILLSNKHQICSGWLRLRCIVQHSCFQWKQKHLFSRDCLAQCFFVFLIRLQFLVNWTRFDNCHVGCVAILGSVCYASSMSSNVLI